MSQEDLLRQRGLNAITACKQKINSISTFLNDKCGEISKSCPTMFYDKSLGKLRPIRGTDPIEPCANYRCAIDQMIAKNNKYERWLLARKWPCSVSGSEDAPLDKPMNADDYLEMTEQVEKFCAREVSQVDNLIRSIPNRGFLSKIKGWIFGGDDDESRLGGCDMGKLFYVLLVILIIVLIFHLVTYVSDSPVMTIDYIRQQ